MWVEINVFPVDMPFIYVVEGYNQPNKSKNHTSISVYYLLFAKWNYLESSGPAKTEPARPILMPTKADISIQDYCLTTKFQFHNNLLCIYTHTTTSQTCMEPTFIRVIYFGMHVYIYGPYFMPSFVYLSVQCISGFELTALSSTSQLLY